LIWRPGERRTHSKTNGPRALERTLLTNRAGVVDRNSPFLALTIVWTDVAQRFALFGKGPPSQLSSLRPLRLTVKFARIQLAVRVAPQPAAQHPPAGAHA